MEVKDEALSAAFRLN